MATRKTSTDLLAEIETQILTNQNKAIHATNLRLVLEDMVVSYFNNTDTPSPAIPWVVAGGTADAITASYNPQITALTDGLIVSFRAIGANTIPGVTFTPNAASITPSPIKKTGAIALAAGDIPAADAEIMLRYKALSNWWEYINFITVPATPSVPWCIAGGTADAITGLFTPAVGSLTDGLLLSFRASAANATTTPTFKADATVLHTITKNGGQPLAIGDIRANLYECLVRYNLANTRWELLNPFIPISAIINGVPVANHLTSFFSATALQDAGAITNHGVGIGGTGGQVSWTGVGTNGQFLVGQTGADPLYRTLSGDVTSVDAAGVVTLGKVNGNIVTAGTGTLTLGAGKTITLSNTLTFTGTDGTSFAFPTASSTVLTKDNTATLTKGFNVTAPNLGNIAATFTPDPTAGNIQFGTNHNAITTFNIPASDCAIDILLTNDATAGVITFVGYTVSAAPGAPLTTTNGNKFWLSIRRANAVATYWVTALQ